MKIYWWILQGEDSISLLEIIIILSNVVLSFININVSILNLISNKMESINPLIYSVTAVFSVSILLSGVVFMMKINHGGYR